MPITFEIVRDTEEYFYCERCGMRTEHTKHPAGYDGETGEPLFISQRRCPKKRFWNSHTNVHGIRKQ